MADGWFRALSSQVRSLFGCPLRGRAVSCRNAEPRIYASMLPVSRILVVQRALKVALRDAASFIEVCPPPVSTQQ